MLMSRSLDNPRDGADERALPFHLQYRRQYRRDDVVIAGGGLAGIVTA